MTVSKESQDGTRFHPDSAWKQLGNMSIFMTEKIWLISASGWLLKRKGAYNMIASIFPYVFPTK